jgi:putative ABC transport system substrate-binding protein
MVVGRPGPHPRDVSQGRAGFTFPRQIISIQFLRCGVLRHARDSYRREDTAWITGRIFDGLKNDYENGDDATTDEKPVVFLDDPAEGHMAIQIGRRDFITKLGGAVATWPIAAWAQQTAMPVVGFLSSRSPNESTDVVAAFRKGLRQMGFVEGQNVLIAFRWAEGHYEQLAALASDLVDLRVAVVFAPGGAPSGLAAKAATSKIPVVFIASEPVELGLVNNLNQPGGNVTGISTVSTELTGKLLGLLKQTMPAAETIGYLMNPSNPVAKAYSGEARAAANTLGIQFHAVYAETPTELDQAFATLAKLRVPALGVMAEPFFDIQRNKLVELSARHRIASCYPWREYVVAGGLMSYGTNLADQYRQAGIYSGRILKGESPASLPVMQPTKFEFVLNLKTAKALGLTIPPGILSITDEVIE